MIRTSGFGIANVRPVEVGKDIEGADYWQDPAVELSRVSYTGR